MWLGGCPERICADNGTEYRQVSSRRMFLGRNHKDTFARNRSFICGCSMGSALNPGGEYQENSFWMNTFKALKENEHFSGAFLDKNLIQFCFLDLIQVTERLRCGYINTDTNFTQKQEVKQMLLNCTTCSHFLYQQ